MELYNKGTGRGKDIKAEGRKEGRKD